MTMIVSIPKNDIKRNPELLEFLADIHGSITKDLSVYRPRTNQPVLYKYEVDMPGETLFYIKLKWLDIADQYLKTYAE